MSAWAKFCGFMLRLMGWTSDNGPVPENKGIILGVPHTSAWDFVISYLFYTHFDRTAHVMIKKEYFVWPLGGLLRKCGCIPVDRTNAAALVKSVIDEMEKDEVFHLAIAPEGTRKPVKKWKLGFHTIAKAVGCPVYLGYFDWGTKHIGIGEKFPLTDDARGDMEKIQAYYESKHYKGKHPKGYITH